MEVLQPLAVGNVRASSRDIFDVLRVDEIDLQPTSFQNLHQRNPVNSGGFHRNRADSTLLQPVGEIQVGMTFSCEPGVYDPGWGGFRHSDTVIVGKCRARSSIAILRA